MTATSATAAIAKAARWRPVTGVPTADRNYCPLRNCIENEIFDLR